MTTPRPWIARTRDFFAYMAKEKGWNKRGHFIMRKGVFWVIGMPMPRQAKDPDNDDYPVLNRKGLRPAKRRRK